MESGVMDREARKVRALAWFLALRFQVRLERALGRVVLREVA